VDFGVSAERRANEELSYRVRLNTGVARADRVARSEAADVAKRRRRPASGDRRKVRGPSGPSLGGLRSDRIIAFIELLKIPDGPDAGKPFVLREWQKDIIRAIYDPVDARGLRLVRQVILTMARKNAKTTLIAALVLVHLVGPEAGRGQQIYSAANDREQASIVYRAAEAMVLMDEDLSALIKTVPSRKRLVCYTNGSFYQALSSDAKTKHGMNPAVWIYDELAQAPKRDLYDALDTAQGVQSEPLGIVISTQAQSPLSLMSELVEDAKRVRDGIVNDPSICPLIFEVPIDADPFDEKMWYLANPALGDFLSLEQMRAAAAKAKRLPSQLARFRNLHLNQQVDGVKHIFGREDWEACGVPVNVEALRGQVCFGGLDLSAKRDLTALVLVFPGVDVMSVLVRCWTPEFELDERADRDRAPYRKWIEQGHLIGVPGKSINYRYVAREIAALASLYDIQGIAYDAWNMHNMRTALNDEGVKHYVDGKDDEEEEGGALRFIEWRQGFKTMSPALESTELAVIQQEIAHGMHPVLNWAAGNAVASMDPAGNRKPDKARARNRIDPFVAMVMAIGCASLAPPPKEATDSIFDNLDALRGAMEG
jgi:phage terminase large subunit-like protein